MGYPVRGLGAWLAAECKKVRKDVASFLIKDTVQLCGQIARIRPLKSHTFFNIDISKYFLSGTDEQLNTDGVDGNGGARGAVAFDTLQLLFQ